MTKKLILLILALPLFLMIILFTATAGVSLAIPIPVTGIEISGEEIVYINMDNPNAGYKLEYTIYPTNVSDENKKVNVTFEPLPTDEETGETPEVAVLEYDESTGILTPKKSGSVKVVVTTVDKGFTDSIIVVVETKELVSISSEINASAESGIIVTKDEETGLPKYEIMPGESFLIETTPYPASASNTLVTYKSDNTDVVTVKASGKIETKRAGIAIVTVTSKANSLITSSFIVEVKNPGGADFYIPESKIEAKAEEGKINMSVTTEKEYSLEARVFQNGKDVTEQIRQHLVVRVGSDNKSVDYYFNEDSDDLNGVPLEIRITISVDGEEDKLLTCTITKSGESAEDKGITISPDSDVYGLFANQKKEIFFELLPIESYKNVTVKAYTENSQVFTVGEVEEYGDSLYSVQVNSKLVGVGSLKIEVTDNNTGEIIKSSIAIVVKPNSLLATSISSGIELSYTIGKYNADGSLFSYYLQYKLNDTLHDTFYDHISWTSDNEAVTVDKDGRIVFVEGKSINDFVTFKAVFSYGGITVSSQSVKIRCISDGYNVTNYKDLVRLTKEGKIVVLQSDIINTFGKDGSDEDNSGNMLPDDQLYTWLKSTYDTTWYQNYDGEIEDYDWESAASVKVLISFKNDIYGNGHTINANNVVGRGQSTSYDTTGQPVLDTVALFRGPLYFAALKESPISGNSNASVAAQDNIAFAAYEGVTINNIVLISRNMASDESGSANLQNLHYAGTTLEVLGDNVTLEYSRVRNGRNVIRAFGDVEDPKKVITFTVKNSILSEARDFIMRVGSNCFVDGTASVPSPYLPGDNGSGYAKRHDYASLSDAEKADYDAKYIKTNIVLQNTVLQNPGIFAIGMDSHFAGGALMDATIYSSVFNFMGDGVLDGWHDLAKTSYGVKLTFEGDVRMYCWKDLETVDSSSLIETSASSSLGDLKDTLSFNIKELVPTAISKNQNLKNVTYKYNGKDYIHAGIAFFGGGKNYGVLEDTNYSFRDYNHYEISLVDVGALPLQVAAGTESFYFFIHDALTAGFLPQDQEALLSSSSEAYSCVYQKYEK